MILRPENVRQIGEGLDHPECLCIADDGTIYCGGEAGQIYQIKPSGEQSQITTTDGFLLGMAVAGNGSLDVCDLKHQSVIRINIDGSAIERSCGTRAKPMMTPNFPIFSATGALYVSDSGDYWHSDNTSCIFVIQPDNSTEVFHRGPFAFANGLAIDSSHEWLYIAQTTAHNIVRIPLRQQDGPIEITHQLPRDVLPDGLAFAADGTLIIACYKPDAVYLGHPDGSTTLLFEDPTGELLNRPTNAAIFEGGLYLANFGGWHLSAIATEMIALPLQRS